MNENTSTQHIVEVPIEFYENFRDDPVTAWQSYGSIPRESEFPYFEDRRAVHDMVDKDRLNPLNDRLEFVPDFLCADDNYRFMHIDLGWTHDACGISMCYVSDWIKVRVRREDISGDFYFSTEFRPVFTFDFLCTIQPDDFGGEIIFEHVRRLIYEVNARGFPILLITFDRFQSVDTMQILRRGTDDVPGFICANLSLDRTTTYPVIDVSKPEKYRKVSVDSGKYANLAVWRHGKSAINTRRIHLPVYKPQTDTLVYNAIGTASNVDDFGRKLDETDYITLVEREALGATFDSKALKVKEAPRGSIDLLESVLGAAFNANNNVTEFEIDETALERRRRLLRKVTNAPTVLDEQDARDELAAAEDIPQDEREDEDDRDRADASIFDEGENIDNARYY